MSDISLEPNGLDLSCDKYVKVLNKLMKAKDLKVNPSQEGVFDVEQIAKVNPFI